jgi:hypothetical protein
METLLCILDFSHVKRPDSSNLVLSMNNSRCLSLGLRKDDVDKVLHGRNYSDPLEIVLSSHVGKLVDKLVLTEVNANLVQNQ